MTIQQFLKKHDNVELTLTNDNGDSYYAGLATFVKPYNTKSVIRFHIPKSLPSYYTKAILHSGVDIFGVRNIEAGSIVNKSIIDLEVI